MDDLDPMATQNIDLVLEAEDLGYSRIWARDLILRSNEFDDADQEFDALIYLSHLAAVTNRIEFGTAAISLPFRHPAIFARQAASLHILSGERFTLGVGTGFRPDLYKIFGSNYDERHSELLSALIRFHELLNGASVSGTYQNGEFENHSLGAISGRVQNFPVLLASSKKPPYDFTPYVDGWLTHRRRLSTNTSDFAEYRCSETKNAKDPRRQIVVMDFGIALDTSPGTDLGKIWVDNVLICSTQELLAALRAYGKAGVDEVILAFVGEKSKLEQMRLVGKQVIPYL